MTPTLSVRDLTVHFGDPETCPPALHRASFDIASGQSLAVIGESGSGKSTLCNTLTGLFTPARSFLYRHAPATVSGQALFKGHCLLHLSATERQALHGAEVALLPQGIDALNPLMTVGNHIIETLAAHGRLPRSHARTRALELLERFHLPEANRIARAYPYQLSGGMARRALMAVTLACAPRLVLADEPTQGLDNETRDRLLATLAVSIQENQSALLLVTHDLEVAATCDHVAVLEQGRIVEQGPARQLFAAPAHPYTQRLLQAGTLCLDGNETPLATSAAAHRRIP